MHVDASRLVDHQHQAVAVKQAREDFVWSHLLRVIPGRREAPDSESITGIWIPGSLAPLAPRNDQGCLSYRNRYHGPAMNENNKQSWWKRLSGGLKRSSSALGTAISDLVSKRRLDAAAIQELEDELIRADLGVET